VQRLASGMGGEYEDDPGVLVDTPPRGNGNWDEQNYAATRFESHAYPHDAAQGIDDQLDDQALGHDIDQEVAAELSNSVPPDEDLPFDPADARAFDGDVKGGTDANYVSGYAETDMPETAAYDELHDPLSVSGSYDPYGTEAGQPPQPGYESTTMGGPIIDDAATPTAGARAESLVEDDLEEVDFYVSQGMYAEATESLRTLWERHPNHPLLLAKHREIESLQGSTSSEPEITGGTDALDMDEIEEVSADDLEEVDENGQRVGGKRKPTVMLQKPVDESDAETHYDLGLAYKEMGLFDEAVKAFEKVLRAPGREIQCRIMIGMCFREQNNPNEAIHQFKQGLHANGSDRERLSLYYEIGITYESMGDYGEALYYFEAVTKRDGTFADAAQRAESLRMQGGHPTPPPEDDI
jgi:tetratricopeptide (TPR) repeat protein